MSATLWGYAYMDYFSPGWLAPVDAMRTCQLGSLFRMASCLVSFLPSFPPAHFQDDIQLLLRLFMDCLTQMQSSQGSQNDLYKLQIFSKEDFCSECILSREEWNSRGCIWLFLPLLHPCQDVLLFDYLVWVFMLKQFWSIRTIDLGKKKKIQKKRKKKKQEKTF